MHLITLEGESMDPTFIDGCEVIVQNFYEPIELGEEFIEMEQSQKIYS